MLILSFQQNMDANNGMQGVATAAQYYQWISVYKNIIQMTTVFLLTKVLLGRASSRQYCPSQHC